MKSNLSRRIRFALAFSILISILGALPARVHADEKAAIVQAVFRVDPEIDCPSCEDFIQHLLVTTKGVRTASIDVITNRITVHYDASQCTIGKLINRIQISGYKAFEVK